MFQIEMLPAEYGDCLWIEYGKNKDEIHRILIDGGTLSCGNYLRERIESLAIKDRYFDLVVVTHIDTDHIDGILRLLQNKPEGFEFDHFWFNAYEHTRPEGFLGAKQGEYLTVELLALEKKINRKFWNEAFGRKAAMIPDSGDPITVELKGGMQVTVLGPTSKALRALRKDWDKVMKEAKMTGGDSEEWIKKLKENKRYRPGWLGTVDVNKLANTVFTEDDKAANGSSIILLADYDKKKVLLAGDAFPTSIINGLKRAREYDGSRTFLDAFKIPHHGSQNNNSNDLFKAMDCSKYLVSTNGKRFGHPDDETIGRILFNKKHKKSNIYFNYTPVVNKIWSDSDLESEYSYYAKFSENGNLKIDLNEPVQ